MKDILIVIFSAFGAVVALLLAIPWVAFVITKYWSWCLTVQERMKNANR